MALALREYKGGAAAQTLASQLAAATTTTFTLAADPGSSWPTGGANGNFVVIIDRNTASEEKVLCSARSGATCTIAGSGRGYDGTAAALHAAGAVVEHGLDATTIDDLNSHVYDTSRDDHTQYLNTTRHNETTVHTVGGEVPAGTAGDIAASAVGDTATAGSTGKAADAGHRHPREAFAAPAASAVGDAQSAGSGTTVARANHVHAREAFVATPSTQAIGDAAAGGAATTVTRGDHKHAMPAFGSPVAVGTANADGSAATIARSDHVHQDLLAPAWTSYTPTFTASTGGAALGNGTITGRYVNVGKTLIISIQFTVGSTTNIGTGYFRFGLPGSLTNKSGITQLLSGMIWDTGNGYEIALGVAQPGESFLNLQTTGAVAGVGEIEPIGIWGAGDVCWVTGVIEVN